MCSPEAGPSSSGSRPARVLVVDDAERVLNFLEIKLRASGYSVQRASNGDSAIDLVRSFRPDILVLDVSMPGKDGIQTLREARVFCQAPALLISGYDVGYEAFQGLGRVDFLAKPFNPDELLLRLRRLASLPR